MTDQQTNKTAEEVKEEEVLEQEEPVEETTAETDDPSINAESGTSETVAEPVEAAAEEQPAEDWQDKYTRLYAEFQNFRRRTDKEKNDIYAFANEKFAMGLLEVVDNFERAMEHGSESDPKFAEGMQLILKQLQGVLEKNNVEEIEAQGKPFDPNYHNAVMTEAAEAESGTVTKVLQKGYMLNKKVIRPSMVAVAQ